MNINFFKKLSNADSIASNEKEVRDILVDELKEFSDDIYCDNIGSIIFDKKGTGNGPKIMLCAHMDEVGFIVRSISDKGQIMLMEVGGVKVQAKALQKVRITIKDGRKINGIINCNLEDGIAKNLYVDIGATNYDDVISLGIDIGDMVTFTSDFEALDLNDIVIGKAFDDRLGLYIIGEVLKKLKDKNHPNDVYVVGTSSEEVGIRGARTATYKVNPDVVFPIDVACFSNEFIRDHTNNRQISKGMMITNFDRTLVPNKNLIEFIKSIAKKINKNVQLDMFTTGGTDGGEAHKVYDGKVVAVSCIPVRYGHCAYSIANKKDIEDAIDIFVEIIMNFNNEVYKSMINYLGGK